MIQFKDIAILKMNCLTIWFHLFPEAAGLQVMISSPGWKSNKKNNVDAEESEHIP